MKNEFDLVVSEARDSYQALVRARQALADREGASTDELRARVERAEQAFNRDRAQVDAYLADLGVPAFDWEPTLAEWKAELD